MDDVDATWPLLDVRRASVLRLIGATMASLRIERVREAVTVRIPSTSLAWKVGETVLAGGIERHSNFTLVAVERGPDRFWTNRDYAMQSLSPAKPAPTITEPPAYLAILQRHGLLPDPRVVRKKHWDRDAVGALIATYDAREAIAQGFVHYDHKWGNDTDDVIADVAEILGQRGRLVSRGESRRELRFAVTESDGTITEHSEDNLDDAAAVIDAWLERSEAPLRLFRWDSGDDHISLLARSLLAGRALAAELGDGTLDVAHSSRMTAADDPDFF